MQLERSCVFGRVRPAPGNRQLLPSSASAANLPPPPLPSNRPSYPSTHHCPLQRASLIALFAVGGYDMLQASHLDTERAQLNAEYRHLTRAALEAAGGSGSSGSGGGKQLTAAAAAATATATAVPAAAPPGAGVASRAASVAAGFAEEEDA